MASLSRRLAMRWLNLAAEKGHVQAQAVLGRMLFMGESTQRQGLARADVAACGPGERHGKTGMPGCRTCTRRPSKRLRKKIAARAQIHAEKFLKAGERR